MALSTYGNMNLIKELERLDEEHDNPCSHCACYPKIKEHIEQARKKLTDYLNWLRKSNEQWRKDIDEINNMIEDKIIEVLKI